LDALRIGMVRLNRGWNPLLQFGFSKVSIINTFSLEVNNSDRRGFLTPLDGTRMSRLSLHNFFLKMVFFLYGSALIFMTLDSSICLTFTRSLKKRSRNERWNNRFYHQLNVPSLSEIIRVPRHPLTLYLKVYR